MLFENTFLNYELYKKNVKTTKYFETDLLMEELKEGEVIWQLRGS
jgi:hypothetical protein